MFSEDFEQHEANFNTLSIKEKGILFVVGISLLGLGFFIGRTYTMGVNDAIVTEVERKQELSGNIYVDIGGAVQNPGVYKLREGARMTDLVALSGGVTAGMSTEWVSKNLNLAAELHDSQKIYIPFSWDVNFDRQHELEIMMSSESVNSEPQIVDDTDKSNLNTLNVNSASQTELESLKGIGKVYSQRIIENRPYDSIEMLVEKADVPESVIKNVQNLISF